MRPLALTRVARVAVASDTMRTLERCSLLFSIESLAKEERVLAAIITPAGGGARSHLGSLSHGSQPARARAATEPPAAVLRDVALASCR